MASLELGELAHEGSSDIGIDLAVKKDWPVGFPKLRGELVQVVQSPDGRSLKTEALCDRRSFLAGLTAPAVLAFAAKAQSAGRRETLRVAPETLTNIFDPHFTTSFTTRDFSYLVFDTLFAVNDRWEPRPQMIERWDRSADGMTWTFRFARRAFLP